MISSLHNIVYKKLRECVCLWSHPAGESVFGCREVQEQNTPVGL